MKKPKPKNTFEMKVSSSIAAKCSPGESFESEIFEIRGYRFTSKFYPNGDTEANSGKCIVVIACMENMKVSADFQIELFRNGSKVVLPDTSVPSNIKGRPAKQIAQNYNASATLFSGPTMAKTCDINLSRESLFKSDLGFVSDDAVTQVNVTFRSVNNEVFRT
jgi:hypothetical protein